MQQDYNILPQRIGKTDGSFKKLQSISFFTNFYQIALRLEKFQIYQYDIKLPEEVPQDSRLYDKSVISIRDQLKKDIGYKTHKGQMIWGIKLSKLALTYECKFTHLEQQYSYEAIITQRKILDVDDLNSQDSRAPFLQFLNISLKQVLNQRNMCQLGKSGKFFQSNQEEIQSLKNIGLDIIRGFQFTLVPINRGICLRIDVCSRILQNKSLLEFIQNKGRSENNQSYIDSTVITKYGNYKTYKVLEIDYSKNPLSKFHNQKKGIQMTYEDYYKDVYGVKIVNKKQPLIKVLGNSRKQIKNGKLIEIEQFAYLIPELISPTGLTIDQTGNFEVMKKIAPFTKLTPVQRIQRCNEIVKILNENKQGLIEIKQSLNLPGYCLPKPEIEYNGSKIKPDQSGIIKHRGVLKQAYHFKNWLMVYSTGKNSERDDKDADELLSVLEKAGKTYGIKFNQPGFLSVSSSRVEDWIKQIQQDITNNGAPSIIVFLLNSNEQKKYGQIKRYIINKLHCPSQCIRKKTVLGSKGAMSAASKICIQMNVKVGSTPWAVHNKHDYFKKKNVMYGGLSLSKGAHGYTLAFVGTIKNDCTQYFSSAKVGIKNKQEISVDILETLFVDWAKSYYQNNGKKVPDSIIIYRQGLSEAQAKNELRDSQIPALNNMVELIGKRTKTNNYKPELMIVLVNKKVNNRFFNTNNQGARNNSKTLGQIYNPDSGSVIIEAMSSGNSYDFYLAPQNVTQGTCTPTLFKVAYDKTKMPQQALIQFTYNQCFNYYNWQGAVRVPACLQNANKLSKLVGEYIKEDIEQSQLTKKPFFF